MSKSKGKKAEVKKIKSKVKKGGSKKQKNKYLNLLVEDKDKIRFVKLKRSHSKSFIDKFGLLQIPSLDDFMEFKQDMKKS